MSEWVRICHMAELLPGECQTGWDGDTPIAVFNVDGDLYAIEDICTHDGSEFDPAGRSTVTKWNVRDTARDSMCARAQPCARLPTERPQNSLSRLRMAGCIRGTIRHHLSQRPLRETCFLPPPG